MTDALGRPEPAPKRIFGDQPDQEVFVAPEKEPPRERVAQAIAEVRRRAVETLSGLPSERLDKVVLAALTYAIARRSPARMGRTLQENRMLEVFETELYAAMDGKSVSNENSQPIAQDREEEKR